VPQTPESFTHDDDGNLTSDGRWTNVWDAENRLIEQTSSPSAVAAGAPNLKLANIYDYAGRRIQKTVSEWNGITWSQKYRLNFIYDGWNLVAEVSASNGPILRSYAWGADLSGGEAAGGIGGLAFIRYHLEEKTVAVAADAQGNTAALHDMANGIQVATYEYGPFGEPLRASGPFADANPFRFSTKYQDPETGWLYYGYRYYNPTTGRWASRDPIGEAGGINLYGFVGNGPSNAVDAFGLAIEFNWFNPGDGLYEAAESMEPIPGVIIIGVHGSEFGFYLTTDKMIEAAKQHPKYTPTISFWLLSCESGKQVPKHFKNAAMDFSSGVPTNPVFAADSKVFFMREFGTGQVFPVAAPGFWPRVFGFKGNWIEFRNGQPKADK
jgi:RHS repeat-associated protein